MMPFGFSVGRTYHGPATDSYASRTAAARQVGHGQVAVAGQVLVAPPRAGGCAPRRRRPGPRRPPARCPPSSPFRRAAPTLDRPAAARPARAAAPRRTAAGPRSGPRAAAARRRDGARAWPRAWWDRCPRPGTAARPPATSICAGAPGSMTTRSPAASARAKMSRAGSSIASLPGGPNSREDIRRGVGRQEAAALVGAVAHRLDRHAERDRPPARCSSGSAPPGSSPAALPGRARSCRRLLQARLAQGGVQPGQHAIAAQQLHRAEEWRRDAASGDGDAQRAEEVAGLPAQPLGLPSGSAPRARPPRSRPRSAPPVRRGRPPGAAAASASERALRAPARRRRTRAATSASASVRKATSSRASASFTSRSLMSGTTRSTASSSSAAGRNGRRRSASCSSVRLRM